MEKQPLIKVFKNCARNIKIKFRYLLLKGKHTNNKMMNILKK